MNLRWQFPDGQIVMLDRPFTRGDVNYPGEWLRQMSAEDRAAWGLVELPEPEAPNTPAPQAVPSYLTPLQARKVLRAVGLKEQVDALLAQAPEEVREEWEFALQIERQNPTLLSMAEALALTSEQLDQLFIDGARL